MKKSISWLLILALCLSLAACGKQEQAPAEPAETPEAAEPAEPAEPEPPAEPEAPSEPEPPAEPEAPSEPEPPAEPEAPASWQDSVLQKLEETKEQVGSVDESGYMNGYLVMELTGDDNPELFVKNEDDTTVYTYLEGEGLKKLGTVPGCTFSICPLAEENSFAVVCVRQFVEEISTYTVKNGILIKGAMTFQQGVEGFMDDGLPKTEVGYHIYEYGSYFSLEDLSGLEQPLQPSEQNQQIINTVFQ